MIEFEWPERVWIVESRWCIEIRVVDALGKEHVFIASADQAMTAGDGIWFGTKAEHDADTDTGDHE